MTKKFLKLKKSATGQYPALTPFYKARLTRFVELCSPNPTDKTRGRSRVASYWFRRLGRQFQSADLLIFQRDFLSGALAENVRQAQAFWEEEIKIKTEPPSPLRYPGGKGKGFKVISEYIPNRWNVMISPFFGGGNLEIHLVLTRGVRVYGFDLYGPVVDYWQVQLTRREELAARIAEIFLLKALLYHQDKTFFNRCQQALSLFERQLDRASCFFWLNRGSFSGSTCCGGKPQEHHQRFTLSSIEKVRRFSCPQLTVELADFRDSLNMHPGLPAYLDPPYAVQSKLYGNKGDLHVNFPHAELAAILHRRRKWVLSYNDCEYIRTLYSGYRILEPEWPYSMSKKKKSNEVLILSNDIVLP